MRGKKIAFFGLWLLSAIAGLTQAADSLQITGTVTGPDGPVDKAAVQLYQMVVDTGSMSYSVHPAGDTETDDQGRFAFSTNPDESVGMQIYCCVAQKKGLSCGWATLVGMNQTVANITLTAPQKIIGFVENTDGTPVEAAEVRLVVVAIPGEGEQFMLGIEPVDLFATKTCDVGRFEFNNLPESATAEFLVQKPGKGTMNTLNLSVNPSEGLTYKAGQTDIILTMEDGVTLSGKVLTQGDQQPVGGIPVAILNTQQPINLSGEPQHSADDGSFTFVDLAPGDYRISIQDDDWIAKPVTVTMGKADVDDTVIELTKGGTLKVHVVDSASEEPVGGVTVIMRLADTNTYQQAVTDASGVAQKQVVPGNYQITIYAQGYRSTGQPVTIAVENNKTASVTIPLGGQAKIAGRVQTADGQAVEGAVVRMVPHSGSSRGSIQSDADGQFKMAWDPGQLSWAEGEFYLVASCPDKNLAGVAQIGDDTTEATIILEKGITIHGKVLTADGNPIPQAKVILYFCGSRFSTSFGPETQTDDEGRYAFTSLAPEQQYSVNITKAEGYGTDSRNVDAGSGAETVEVEDIVLRVADQALAGMVVDQDDKPIANVRVTCYGQGQPRLNTTTDTDGTFSFDNVCGGEIRINANYNQGSEFMYGSVQTEGGAQDVRVILTPQGTSRYVQRQPASLVGKPLPELSEMGLASPEEAGPILLFVWDMNQRPSRHYLKQLAAQKALLSDKGVTVLLLNTAPAQKEPPDTWLRENGIDWACGVLGEDADETTFKMGVQGLPWLILTDASHTVVAEGFDVDELGTKLP